jgi:hypothetical protein
MVRKTVEEALIEACPPQAGKYPAGGSARRAEDIGLTLQGTLVSPGTVGNVNKKIYERIQQRRNRPIEGDTFIRPPGDSAARSIIFQAATGVVSGPTTHLSESCWRSGDERAWLAPPLS